MTERRMPEQHRARSRDRSDQRRPTFQVLNAVQPRTHTHGKRNIISRYDLDPPSYDYGASTIDHEPGDYESQLQKRFVAGMNTIGGNKSCESVANNYRGPACNFRAKNNNTDGANARSSSQSLSPGPVGRPRSQSPQDRVVMEEPSDLVVWNPSKKASRSNLLCPLTESEFRNINLMDTKILKAPRPRSNSTSNYRSNNHRKQQQQRAAGVLEERNNVIFNVNNLCKEAAELLDDFAPPPMSPTLTSPTASVTSTTYSLQISLVTQQLEEIQQAQNDVLKHLGEEIAKVTDENERLKKEVDHVRDQNEGLLKVVNDTSDELERMKHIFRTRSLSHPTPQPHQRNKHEVLEEEVEEEEEPSPLLAQRHRSNKKQVARQGGKRDRDGVVGKNKKSIMGDGDTVMVHLVGSGGTGESTERAVGKQQLIKSKKSERSKQPVDMSREDQEMNLTRDMDANEDDENVSNHSKDLHAKSSRERRQESLQCQRRSHNHHHRAHGSSHDRETRRQSKERRGGRSKSPRASNCYVEDGKKTKQVRKSVYLDEDGNNDDFEQSQSKEGCWKSFFCCLSSSNSGLKTDNVDDIVLRECPE